jgi:hypothetical protein
MADKSDGNDDDDVYELSDDASDIPSEWRSVAVYEMEAPARCPYCREVIRTLRVLKLTRTQAPFTSTLSRGGRVLVCPACDRILSADVSGLI